MHHSAQRNEECITVTEIIAHKRTKTKENARNYSCVLSVLLKLLSCHLKCSYRTFTFINYEEDIVSHGSKVDLFVNLHLMKI